ncbi:MAG: family 16 glycoside hydrolase, partial [Chloroflexota bacterium]
IIKVTGPCGPNSRSAVLAPGFIPGLDIPDGEIRFEFKVVTGHDRAELFVGFRGILNENCYLGYELDAVPGQGEMRIRKYAVGCEPSSAVAGRADLRASFHRDDWNNLAIRLHGANQWVFLNDVLVLSVADSTFDRGAIMIGVARLGNLGDTAESAIVIRNLRVSQLAP